MWRVVHREVEVLNVRQNEYLCVATYLPLRSWMNVVPFLRLSSRIGRQLTQSEGVVRFGVRTQLSRKRFWTISIWTDREKMRAFSGKDPHLTAVRRFPAWAGQGAAFVEYTSGTGRIDWDEAFEKLKTPTFYYDRALQSDKQIALRSYPLGESHLGKS